jgi:hypothetical protein
MNQGNERKKIAIVQSNYIPWKGYFDMINMVDEFVLYDEVQYTRRDWRNRNMIKTPHGLKWLTIPVMVKNKYFQEIRDTKIADKYWAKKHWQTIKHYYSKARYFKDCKDLVEPLYLNNTDEYLSQINHTFITTICGFLGIGTRISWSFDYGDYSKTRGKTQRLVELCRKTGALEYLSGPSAKNYIDEKLFAELSIKLTFMDYSGYPEYKQLYCPFAHHVSIIDLIFNQGPEAVQFMKSFNR